ETGDLAQLEEQWLDDNPIQTLPASITRLNKLKRLHIHGTPQLPFSPPQQEWLQRLEKIAG
ncbi:MAG: leucine-rich repeat domain-containing protein, partial [Neisseria sp.]